MYVPGKYKRLYYAGINAVLERSPLPEGTVKDCTAMYNCFVCFCHRERCRYLLLEAVTWIWLRTHRGKTSRHHHHCRMPKLGETMMGDRFAMGCGGKGANQAVQAAKLGCKTSFVGCIGSDVFGKMFVDQFKEIGIDSHLRIADTTTGVAPITVDASGNNSIIIVPGANLQVTPSDIADAADAIISSDCLLCQNEISMDATIAALRLARNNNVTAIFNSAPASADCLRLLSECDIFCPNEVELSLFTTHDKIDSVDAATKAALSLLDTLPTDAMKPIILVTLGSRGSIVVTNNGVEHYPSSQVPAERVIDTTGAGDSYLGSLGYFLSVYKQRNHGQFNLMDGLRYAIPHASRVAAYSVQRRGTQTSFMNKNEIDFTY